MKTEKFRTMLLPIGLLLVTGAPFIGHLTSIKVPDFANGFLKGIGIGLMVLVLVMQKVSKSCKYSAKN